MHSWPAEHEALVVSPDAVDNVIAECLK